MASKRKTNELEIAKKVEVIKALKTSTVREVASKFSISTGTVSNIKKRQDEYFKAYEENVSSFRKRKPKASENIDINESVWQWFLKARRYDVPVSGQVLKEVALEFAAKLNRTDFKASNGWLEKFVKRHNISFKTLSGEASSADTQSAEDFRSKLSELCKGYSSDDIFNVDETGLMYKGLPEKSYVEKVKGDKGIKIKKDRITIMLAVSATGEKLKPLVIGHSENPRCFKNISRNSLGVTYKFNTKAWMTMAIFNEWIETLNRQMALQNRQILLLLDNCSSHPKITLSNVNLLFLPANTTSLIQPLDQGIIKDFKAKYRKYLVRSLVSNLEGAKEFLKSLSILDAIRWTVKAWNDVKITTVQNCFKKCGFDNLSSCENEEPQVNEESELDEIVLLLKNANVISEASPADSYSSFDNDLVTTNTDCSDLVSEVLSEMGASNFVDLTQESIEVEDISPVNELPIVQKSEVLDAMQKLKSYATVTEPALLNAVCDLQDLFYKTEAEKCVKMHQKKITDYFK